jgi:hypothetical protein
VLLLSYLIYAQRQALSFVDSRIKAVDQQMKALGATIQTVDLQMKAADAVRLESREAQESRAKDITGRVTTIATINDELRKDAHCRSPVENFGLACEKRSWGGR